VKHDCMIYLVAVNEQTLKTLFAEISAVARGGGGIGGG
jgi:hypothetical protein